MKTIKTIIYNLKNENNQEFDIFNNRLKLRWLVGFEFVEGKILMMTNNSILTSEWFDNLKQLENHLNSSFLTQKEFELNINL